MEKSGHYEDEESEGASVAERVVPAEFRLAVGAKVRITPDKFAHGQELLLRDKEGEVLAVIGKNPRSNDNQHDEMRFSYTLRTADGHKILIPIPGTLSTKQIMTIGDKEKSGISGELQEVIKRLFSQDFTLIVGTNFIDLINNNEEDESYLFWKGVFAGRVESDLTIGAEQVGIGKDGDITGLINGSRKFCAATRRELGESKYSIVNEDNIGVNRNNGVLVLVDGMGGYGYGEHASHIGVEGIINARSMDLRGKLAEARDKLALLNRAVNSSFAPNAAIVAVQLDGDKCCVTYRGDCRLLHIRNGKCIYMTPPRNMAWRKYLNHIGDFSYVSTFNNLERSTVTSSLSDDSSRPSSLDYVELTLEQGDKIVMYGDGIALSEAEITKTVVSCDPEDAVNFLLEETEKRNIQDRYPIVIDNNLVSDALLPDPIMNIGEFLVAKYSPKDNASVIVYEHS
jgi:serine/threonine protein phosphatase PrpC